MTAEERLSRDSEGVRQARAVYQRLMTPELEREHYDKLIMFDLDTYDFEIGEDFIEIARRLKARRPGGNITGFRIGDGGRAIDRFRSPRFASEQ